MHGHSKTIKLMLPSANIQHDYSTFQTCLSQKTLKLLQSSSYIIDGPNPHADNMLSWRQ